ncbi:MAG TPA: hypothetical protein VK658_17040 [Chryseolinea sp.]|nr:hypothetical protein [Chryseolinea sp.]
MDFEAYLISKRIDSARFKSAEPELWQSWRVDFDQMHPNSFTVQKLNLINPIRRKYQLSATDTPKAVPPPVAKPVASPVAKTVMKVPRPGMSKSTTTEIGEAAAPATTPGAADTAAQSQEVPNESPLKSEVPAKPVIPRPVIKPKPKTN